MVNLSDDEKKLVEHAKKAFPKLIKSRRGKDVFDTIYACIISDSGNIYEGIPLETKVPNASVCCERIAIANMVFKETERARVKAVLVVGPVGKGGLLTPCGVCRTVIDEYSDGKATVLNAGDYFERSQTDFDSLFKNMKRYTIKELYPNPWKEGKW